VTNLKNSKLAYGCCHPVSPEEILQICITSDMLGSLG